MDQFSWSDDDMRAEIVLQCNRMENINPDYTNSSDDSFACLKCAEPIEPDDDVTRMICNDESFFHSECAIEYYCVEKSTTCILCGEIVTPAHVTTHLE